MKFYLEQTDSVFSQVKSSESGLSSAEAEKRLSENGKNKLKEGKKKSIFSRPDDNYPHRRRHYIGSH